MYKIVERLNFPVVCYQFIIKSNSETAKQIDKSIQKKFLLLIHKKLTQDGKEYTLNGVPSEKTVLWFVEEINKHLSWTYKLEENYASLIPNKEGFELFCRFNDAEFFRLLVNSVLNKFVEKES